jgi:hypothetical protein
MLSDKGEVRQIIFGANHMYFQKITLDPKLDPDPKLIISDPQ